MNTTTVSLANSELVAIVDRADSHLVAGFRWRLNHHKITGLNYAHAWHGSMHIYMHRLVIGAGADDYVDHANRNGLDNRLSNLRIASPSENHANRVKEVPRLGQSFTSRYKGVYWDKRRGKWTAQVSHYKVNGKQLYLGRYDVEEDAARAYDKAAVEIWGEYARLNLPDTSQSIQLELALQIPEAREDRRRYVRRSR